MHKTSAIYKEIMDRPLRNRGRIQVGLGVVCQEAQGSAELDYDNTDLTDYSDDTNIFKLYDIEQTDYATLEQNFMTADGRQIFVPEEETDTIVDTGIITDALLGAIKIEFSDHFNIKGLTLSFGSAYPTSFKVITEDDELTFSNDSEVFETTDVIGDTQYIIIQPITMVGGQQRLHLHSATMGVGLTWGNADISNSTFTELISPVSEESSSQKISITVLDPENKFDVDNSASFMNYLEIGNDVTISYGLELDDGNVEWVDMGSLELKDWKTSNNQLKFNAVDKLAMMKSKFTKSNKIYTRTAYAQAVEIFEDLEFEERDYVIDDSLKNIILTNPMPEKNHKQCLQLLANACRCICYQNWQGQIVIQANYGLVLDIHDLSASCNEETDWSDVERIIYDGYDTEYADLTEDFLKADGSQFFMDYGQTTYKDTVGYVSESVADDDGLFDENPTITYELTAGYEFYGINLEFGGNHPTKMNVKAYFENVLVGDVDFDITEQEQSIYNIWNRFDKMVFEFTEAHPNDRVVVRNISYGEFTDYVLTKHNMLETHLNGYKEELTKSVSVKVYSFTTGTDGKPKKVDDDVWYKETVNTSGTDRTCENQLISTESQAHLVAEWLASYFWNNVEYDIKYRGEPRVNATDIIRCENDYKENMQLVVTTNKLTFDGGWSGTLDMRRAIKLGEYKE